MTDSLFNYMQDIDAPIEMESNKEPLIFLTMKHCDLFKTFTRNILSLIEEILADKNY